jgi:hypothetical protein
MERPRPDRGPCQDLQTLAADPEPNTAKENVMPAAATLRGIPSSEASLKA